MEKGMVDNVTILAPPKSREERVGKDKLVRQAMRSCRSDDPGQGNPDVCEALKKDVQIYEEAVASGHYEGI